MNDAETDTRWVFVRAQLPGNQSISGIFGYGNTTPNSSTNWNQVWGLVMTQIERQFNVNRNDVDITAFEPLPTQH